MSFANDILKSNDCWRVFSHKEVNREMFPPTKVCNEPPIEPKIDLERTVMPRTKPKFWVIFLPGNSKAVVMFFLVHMFNINFSLVDCVTMYKPAFSRA